MKIFLDNRAKWYYYIYCDFCITLFLMEEFMNYICALCGYVYKSEVGDPDNGVAQGTDFEDIDESWSCPLCGASKEDFEEADSNDYN